LIFNDFDAFIMTRSICTFMTILMFLPAYAQKKTGVAPTPPMGFNTWNYFHCDVSENLIKEMADAMVSSGMKEAGYQYIVIDDCWQVDRDENGVIVADPERFPSGIKALADYIHAKGLKFGIYSDAGKKTCQKRPGSYEYEAIDARTYEKWGVDYLKYDWCANGLFRTSKEVYPRMAAELAALDRPIVFSMCNWGRQKPWKWAGEYAHLWRTSGDIVPKFDGGTFFFFKSVMEIVDLQQGMEKYAGPDGWNDPDMLQVGNGDLTYDENVAHFTLWCMMAAPLMAGNDLRNMPDDVKSILTNKLAIAVNQDPLGKQGYRFLDEGKYEIYVRELAGGEWAVCLLNRGRETITRSVDLSNLLDLEQRLRVVDIWGDGEIIGFSNDEMTFELPEHSVKFLRLVN
jgi:alpha-galactosidase